MVSRFVQAKQFAREPIPSQFFMPRARGEPPAPERLELSAFEIDGLSDTEIWSLGWNHRVQPGRRLYARADFGVETAGDDLHYEVDEPPDRHRVFHGWPAEEQLQSLIAHDLAEAATYRPHPGGKTEQKAGQPYPGGTGTS